MSASGKGAKNMGFRAQGPTEQITVRLPHALMRKRAKRRSTRPDPMRLYAFRLPADLVARLDAVMPRYAANIPWVTVTRAHVVRALLDAALTQLLGVVPFEAPSAALEAEEGRKRTPGGG